MSTQWIGVKSLNIGLWNTKSYKQVELLFLELVQTLHVDKY